MAEGECFRLNSRDFCVVVEVYRFDTGTRAGECLEICEILYSFGRSEVEIELFSTVNFFDEFRLLARDLSVLVRVEIFKAVPLEVLVFYARADIGFIGQRGGD